jgi:hypothetical protein
MFGTLDPNDPQSLERYRQQVIPMLDQQIRSTLGMIWMALPPERQSVTEVEREFRRMADRALDNLREDVAAFGTPTDLRSP